jgi:hypothetical protein
LGSSAASAGDPHDRGRRQAAHRVAAYEDQAATDEADAGHDLRGQPRRVPDPLAVFENSNVDGHVREQRCAHANENVGTESGRLSLDLPLEADDPAKHDRKTELEQQVEAERADQLRERWDVTR